MTHSPRSLHDQAFQAFLRGDISTAAALFERLATDESPEAWLHVARCREQLGDIRGEATAMRALKSAADDGNPMAEFAMHLATRETYSPFASPQEVAASRQYLRRAAAAGVVPAQIQLAGDCLSGLESGLEDIAGYAKWMEPAAKAGDSEAALALAETLQSRKVKLPEWLVECLMNLELAERIQRRAKRVLAFERKRGSPGS